MKNFFIYIVVFSIFISCKKEGEQSCSSETNTTVEENGFEMYEMSEMALLMEQMYVDNERLKDRILSGDTIGQFPQHFMKIHEAIFTDETDKDAFFEEQAKKFIQAQELIYKDPDNAKEHFNKGVDACIQCHEVKCGGVIPKIKKLYIK